MDKTEKTKPVVIERGTVTEKRIPTGGFWWQYKVTSLTRDGLKSRWMEAAVFWEHMTVDEMGGTANQGFAIGTNVYYFMFGDGRGVILDRIINTAEDYTTKIKLWVDFMNEVKEQHRQILAKLDGLDTSLANAVTEVKNHVTSAKTEIKTQVTDSEAAIKTKVADSETAVKDKVASSETAIKNHVTNAKDALDSKLTSIKRLEDEIYIIVSEGQPVPDL